jgi:hypothetical protein
MGLAELLFVDPLVLLARHSMPSTPRCMRVAVTVVVVPNRADIARVGFEQQLRRRVDAATHRATDGAGDGFGRVGHRTFLFKVSATVGAGEVVLGH